LWLPSQSNQSPFISQPQRSRIGRSIPASLRATRAMSRSDEPSVIRPYGAPCQETISVLDAGTAGSDAGT
jgi:hypothetical protein